MLKFSFSPFIYFIFYLLILNFNFNMLEAKSKTYPVDVRLRYLHSILKHQYGEERYEIKEKYSYDADLYNITVHYPHIHITNSMEQEHDIYDLYIQYEVMITKSRFSLFYIKGARTTFAQKEVINRNSFYIHSHFSPAYHPTIFSPNFCFGSTQFKHFIEKFSGEDDNIKNFSMLLSAMDNYLTWESIEGVPYAYFDKLNTSEFYYRKNAPVITAEFKNKMLESIEKNIAPFEFKINADEVEIIGLREKVEESIKSIKKIPAKYKVCVIGGQAFYPRLRERMVKWRERVQEKQYILFKGEKRYVKIIMNDKKLPVSIHPQIVDNITEQIASKFNVFLNTSYRTL